MLSKQQYSKISQAITSETDWKEQIMFTVLSGNASVYFLFRVNRYFTDHPNEISLIKDLVQTQGFNLLMATTLFVLIFLMWVERFRKKIVAALQETKENDL